MKNKKKQGSEGHVPLFPAYVRQLPDKTLAYYNEPAQTLVTEHGKHIPLPDGDFPGFLALLYEYNLLTFTYKITDFPYLHDCIQRWPQPCSPPIYGDRIPGPISLHIKAQGHWFWIVQSDIWAVPAIHDSETRHVLLAQLLVDLRATYSLCKVGAPSTPGSLGQALMRKSWVQQFGNEWYKHRHARPNMGCVRMILEHGTGGRVDTPKIGEHLDIVQERDIKNAYASCYIRQPTGTAVRTFGSAGALAGFVTFFCRCVVCIPRLLPLGPFPVRRVNNYGIIEPFYPREPGRYVAYLWREEVEDCYRAGCSVEIGTGYGWEHFTFDNAAWVDLCSRLRDSANPGVAEKIKMAVVAGIGRHGMGETFYSLVGRDHADQDVDIQVCDQHTHESLELWIKETKQAHFANMTHWYAYTMMLCRHVMFLEMLPHAINETLAGSNYDAYYVKVDEEIENSLELTQVDGVYNIEWKKTTLHGKPGEPTIPKPRQLNTVEKVRMPGVQRS